MATKYFMAGLSPEWSDTSNWSTTASSGPNNTSPAGAADSVILNAGSPRCVVDVPVTIANLTITSARTLNIYGLLTVTGTLTLPDADVVFGGRYGFTVGTLYDSGITATRTRTFSAGIGWNYYDKGNLAVLSNLNMTLHGTGAPGSQGRCTRSRTTGKYYFELFIDVTSRAMQGPIIGVQKIGGGPTPGRVAGAGWALSQAGIGTWDNGAETGAGLINNTYEGGDTVQIAVDFDAHKIWWGINNTWHRNTSGAVGDPSTGANPRYSDLSGTLFPAIDQSNISVFGTATGHFTASSMTYALPIGFSPWEDELDYPAVYTITNSLVMRQSTTPTVRYIYNGPTNVPDYAYFNLQAGATQDVGFTDPTRMNSLGGLPIFTYHGIITDSPNWFNTLDPLLPDPTSGNIQARGWAG